MAWVLITPSSRGIGHALTRHLLLSTPPTLPIIATYRPTTTTTPPSSSSLRKSLLHDLPPSSASRLDLQPLDLTSEPSLQNLASYCRERYNDTSRDASAHLRLAICLPGMLVPERKPEKVESESALETLRLNLLAPMLFAKHFVPFLPRTTAQLEALEDGEETTVEGLNQHRLAIMAFMSARVGSISDNKLGGWFSYRASKAGLNQFVKTLDIDLARRAGVGGGAKGGKGEPRTGAVCVGLHPGTVKTELSREFWGGVPKGKLFEAEDAAGRLVGVLGGMEGGMGGRCWDWGGREIMP